MREAARPWSRHQPPIAFDEGGDRGGVETRAVDEAPARVGAHEQGRHAETRTGRWPHVIEPAARLVVGPQECRAVPSAAARKRGDQRSGERRTGRDPPGWMLACPRRRYVGDRGKPSSLEVRVVLVE